jgi:hypothetical protein
MGADVCANKGGGSSARPTAACGERGAWLDMKELGYAALPELTFSVSDGRAPFAADLARISKGAGGSGAG